VFLAGAAAGPGARGGSTRLAGTALHLLVHLPAARDAVFEYYGALLDGVVGRHSAQAGEAGQPSITEEEEVTIEELQKVLAGFIETNPEAWAPLVSAWALDNLGRMSSKWSSKISGPPTSLLHDKLSAWLSCLGARCLLELAAACLATLLTSTDTQACVSSLLETSVRYAPHFDWVVAHLGSCFPHTVTSRVLALGLGDFTAAAAAAPGQGEVSLAKVPRLVSVVNILSHLGSTHPVQLEEAVQDLLASSLGPATSPAGTATVPFLLHLASLSNGVRRALATELAPSLLPALPRLAALAPAWIQGRFFASPEAALTLAAQLLVRTDRGGPELLLLLLELGARGEAEVGQQQARALTHLLLAELAAQVHTAPRHRPEEVALLSALEPHRPELLALLLAGDDFQLPAVTQLLCLHSVHRGRAASAGLLAHLLGHSTDATHLATLGHLLAGLELWHPGVAGDAVGRALRSEAGGQGRLLDNLARLVALEREGAVQWRSSLEGAVRAELPAVAGLLPLLPDRALRLLALVPPGPLLGLAEVHQLCHALVQAAYSALAQGGGLAPEARARRLAAVEEVLAGLAARAAGLQMTLRLLLEAALHSAYSRHLGAAPGAAGLDTPRQKAAVSLLRDNLKFGSMPVQPLGSTTVFHAGTIGAGPRVAGAPSPITKEEAEENRRDVAGLVLRLCEGVGQEGTKQLALLLVEMVSPDIMYNGLPWPEEEFIKVTIERDLAIVRLLTAHPIVWTLLALLARSALALHGVRSCMIPRARPALCYCSVLVRAVVAVRSADTA
jgi:integrator complex subunit 5